MIPYIYGLFWVLLSSSIYLTLALGIERYLATKQVLHDEKSGLLFVGPALACAIVFSFPRFFELGYDTYSGSVTARGFRLGCIDPF